jgi:hypothetical protein
MTVDGAYRTDDLIKATILSMDGMEFSLEQGRNGRTAVFVFGCEDREDLEYVQDILDQLVAGTHQVEPFAFAKEMRAVRTRLYRFLEHHSGATPAVDKRRLHQG